MRWSLVAQAIPEKKQFLSKNYNVNLAESHAERGDEILICKTSSDLRVVHSHRSSRSCQASPWLLIASGGLYKRRLMTNIFVGNTYWSHRH